MMCAVIGEIGPIWLELAMIQEGIVISILRNKQQIMIKTNRLESCG
jgi:hypothetical protein